MSDSRITFEATVSPDGRFTPKEVKATRWRLSKWNGRKVLVTVSRYVKPKTNPQLAYFHGIILPALAEHTGEDDLEALKRDVKLAWLTRKPEVCKLTGEETMEVPSLADLNSEEMSAFIDRVIREASKLGCNIPGPNERWEPQEWSA